MITNDEQLDQAVEQLGRMYRALASLKKEVLPKNRQWFTLMAEGPVDEIRTLQRQIDAYIGKADAEINESDVWLRMVGPTLGWPEAPTSIVTAFLDAFRKGVQAVAEFTTTGHLTTRPTKELKRACDLQIVAFQAGSLSIGVRVPDEAQLELFGGSDRPLVWRALTQFLQVADWVGSEDSAEILDHLCPDPHERRVVLNALKPFVPRPRGDVECVEVSGGSTTRSTLSRPSGLKSTWGISVRSTWTVCRSSYDLPRMYGRSAARLRKISWRPPGKVSTAVFE
jgi:hypothetical protein